MTSVEEVTSAVRHVAALEVRIEMLTARIDEMQDHLDQAGFASGRQQSPQIQAGGNTSGCVLFTLSKETMLDSFNGTDRMKFSDWKFKS